MAPEWLTKTTAEGGLLQEDGRKYYAPEAIWSKWLEFKAYF